MTGGASIVFRRKTVVDQICIRNSSNVCKTIVIFDASFLYPFSMCQEMPTALYTIWEYDSETNRLKARNNRTRNCDSLIMSIYQELRPECTIESFTQPESRRKLTVSMLVTTAITVKHYMKLWVANITSVHAKKPFLHCQNKILKGEIRSEKWMK